MQEELPGRLGVLRAREKKNEKAVSKSGDMLNLVGRLQLLPVSVQGNVVEQDEVLRRGVALRHETLCGWVVRRLL